MPMWMVRAGEGGRLIEKFAEGYVAVGWQELGDMSSYNNDKEKMREHYLKSYPDESKGAIANQFAMFYKFHSSVSVSDRVVSYDTNTREYLIGTIIGEYKYLPDVVGDYPHVRKVEWQGRVSRDDITTASRNSLGSVLTLFSINAEVWSDIQSSLNGKSDTFLKEQTSEVSTLEEIRKEIKEKAHEFIKDKILELDGDEMELLVAAILRGMGYKTRVSPKGPDRGVDVIASPDGLGLEEPRIKAEVKHRPKTSMGSHEIRSFLGGLREGDKAIYVSSGGFTKDAKYEADRSIIPLTLLNLDDLADLTVTHYENFDLEGRALIPLVMVYWPAE